MNRGNPGGLDAVGSAADAGARRAAATRTATPPGSRRGVSWEPPTDVLETQDALSPAAALPGADPRARSRLAIHNGALLIAGERALPPELRTATIHRLELPQGRFERRDRCCRRGRLRAAAQPASPTAAS